MYSSILTSLSIWVIISPGVSSTKTGEIKETIVKNGIVPDVIDDAPDVLLSIHYNESDVILGGDLTPSQAANKPISVKWKGEASKFYTLLTVDPDAPSRKAPIASEVKHWLVVNIPGDDLKNGYTLADYRGPGPPKGTGKHRYIFLLYEQSGGNLTFDEKPIAKDSRDGRLHFKTRDFTKKYNLGQPLAINFFFSQWEKVTAKV